MKKKIVVTYCEICNNLMTDPDYHVKADQKENLKKWNIREGIETFNIWTHEPFDICFDCFENTELMKEKN
uniref:Uncharacterized protein n=1 Tax=candidate division CPR3 bacterium TaxID=2268181 RepID=A0A7V3JA49_UNCC3